MRRFALMLSLALLLSACGGIASTPTATPVPTATPEPTKAPIIDVDAKAAITAAFTKVKSATAYRIEISFKAKGNLGDNAPTGVNPDEEVELIGMKGAVNGKDSEIRLQGVFSAFLGADPAKGVEFITVDGKNYVKGPIPLMNAPEDKWYIIPAGQSSPAAGFSSQTLLGSVENDKLDLSGFKVDGSETLDGKACAIYSGDKAAIEKAFKDGSTGGLPTGAFKEFTNAEMRLWICEDGYFRKLKLEMEGIPEGQTEKATIKIDFRLSDFDGDVKIEAPANAEEIKPPTK